MEEDGAKEVKADAKEAEVATAPKPERRTALSVYCENIREAGMLVTVFAALDALFSTARVSHWWVVAWMLFGVGMVYVGVRYDPEVRR